VTAQAGEAALPGVFPGPGQVVRRGDRVRVMAGPTRRGPPGRTFLRGSWFLIIELEPLGAQELVRRALVGLWLSLGTGLILTTAALVLARLARRAQLVEAELGRQQHLASLGEMSAILAHEIRNPLASLKGHAQLLAERADPGTEARALRVVDEAVRLEALTNDLLAFARSGAIDRAPVAPVRSSFGLLSTPEP
jgi:two-component system, NtrC family, sensor histidine kinase HydH